MAIWNMGVNHPRLAFVNVEIFTNFCFLAHNFGSRYGSFHVKSPNKKTILNPTLSELIQIWHTCWFWPASKSQIFCWSDDRFPRYGDLIFWKFRENKGGRPTSKQARYSKAWLVLKLGSPPLFSLNFTYTIFWYEMCF